MARAASHVFPLAARRKTSMSKVAILAAVTLMVGAGYAVAGGGKNTMTSGRPSAALTPEQCQQVWKKAVPSGEFLLEADATPFIVNFKLADGPDQDKKISKAEFEDACAKGLVKFTER
jgi:hypothetical protein